MEKVLYYLNNDLKNKIVKSLNDFYFLKETYFDKYNYNSVIVREKADIILVSSSYIDYELLLKLKGLNKLIVIIKDNEFNIGQDIDLIYQIEKNKLDYLKEFFDIIVKDYKVIKRLNDSISSYKDAEEEARLVKRAKLRLMEQGMSEEESYKYILKSAMQKRITKKELALAILRE